MELSEKLAECYRNTVYRVSTPTGVIELRVDHAAPEMTRLLASHGVDGGALITAYNPYSRALDAAENQRRQQRLESEAAARWTCLPGEGADPDGKWPAEPGVFILGVSESAARELGRRHEQHAILYAHVSGRIELLACEPENQELLLHPLARAADRIEQSWRDAGIKVLPRGTWSPDDGRSKATFVPRRRKPADGGGPETPRRLSPKALQLLGHIMRSNWICPQFEPWMEMWRMLPEVDGGKPTPPVPKAAWKCWPMAIRHEFLVRHIECADARGVIDPVDALLRSLPPDEWVSGFFDLLLEDPDGPV